MAKWQKMKLPTMRDRLEVLIEFFAYMTPFVLDFYKSMWMC